MSGVSIARGVVATDGGGSGSGDVVGPSSATDGNTAAFDGITGKLIKDSGVNITSLSTSTSTGIRSLSTGLSTTNSTATSLSTTVSTSSSGIASLSTGLSTTNSTVATLSTSTSTAVVSLSTAIGGGGGGGAGFPNTINVVIADHTIATPNTLTIAVVTVGNVTVSLPAAPADKDVQCAKLEDPTTSGNSLTINGNGKNIWPIATGASVASVAGGFSYYLIFSSTQDAWSLLVYQ